MMLRTRIAVRYSSNYAEKRMAKLEEIAAFPELIQRDRLLSDLSAGDTAMRPHAVPSTLPDLKMSPGDLNKCVDAALLTFALHVESRVSSALGEGFYTIGPCGEETLAGVAMALRPDDSVALHYRHLSTSLARGFQAGRSVKDLCMDRARGYTVSSLDPIGGGAHCLLGGGPQDFLVTSTLASQGPPAVGRALGGRLAHLLGGAAQKAAPFPKDFVSYVSTGDGSVNNAHFLSAVNLAEYTRHRGFKTPVVFGISDNDRCISLRGYGWLDKFTTQRMGGMPVYRCNGNDVDAVYAATSEAAQYSRQRGAPSAVVFESLSRRFGHAATDRQAAYLDRYEINAAQEDSSVAAMCVKAIDHGVVASYGELATRFQGMLDLAQECFAIAAAEPKLDDREELMRRTTPAKAPPLTPKATGTKKTKEAASTKEDSTTTKVEKPQVMRKHMTRVIDEALEKDRRVVYIGEDVEHGGYYLVTTGLAKKYPGRVSDFPPDETALLGAGIGYAQSGLVPIVEIPYAKYLDCGADMFYEAIVMHWLSGGRTSNGMVLRLQGFDRGVFGGNFHTHNMIHTPPGLDVVCYSNGRDYVRGMRYALRQAKAGRVVMTVDSTAALNERHISDERDDAWMFPYPTEDDDGENSELTFDDVIVYKNGNIHHSQDEHAGEGEHTKNDIPVDAMERMDLMLSGLTVKDLKEQLKASGLSTSGNKAELVERILRQKTILEGSETTMPSTSQSINIGVVTYGNGVRTSLRYVQEAQKLAYGEHESEDNSQMKGRVHVDVIDCPCLSETPSGLRDVLVDYDAVVFADVCKAGPQFPLAGMIADLQSTSELPRHWQAVGATNTYNPLGNTSTFLSEADIGVAIEQVLTSLAKEMYM